MRHSLKIFALSIVFFACLCACSSGSDSVFNTAGQGQVQFVMAGAPATGPTGGLMSGGALGASRSGLAAPFRANDHGSDHGDDHDGDGGDPSDRVQAARATIASIQARTLDGALVPVTIALPVTVDLLGLRSGSEVTLPIGFLPPGTYDQFVVVISHLDIELQSGTVITVTPPGEGWTSTVRVAEPFTVVEGQTTTIRILFRRDRAFRFLGDRWEFQPEFTLG